MTQQPHVQTVQDQLRERSKLIDQVRRRERNRALRDLFALPWGGDLSPSRQGEYEEFDAREVADVRAATRHA